MSESDISFGRKLFRAVGHPTGTALLVAALAFAGGLVGGFQAGSATTEAAEIETRAVQENEHREKRRQVYADYLSSANSYNSATGAFFRALGRIPSDAETEAAIAQIEDEVGAFEQARHDYQGKINDLYVYGSDEAWIAHTGLASTLPEALGNVPNRQIDAVDEQAFGEAYQAFMGVFCREAVPEPRDGCLRAQN
ncbi:hypothetical protein [Crystallibacter crystallopoietes]|uniref:hypothetical protein n=1 Tax=Crystallibacter crystallopoietes TaxID=37928 RepID=UPI00123795CB|nr:hypothetical protein [Arthrobacter crystallopoietes]